MTVHPDQMAPGERAAWANGYDAGKDSLRKTLEAARGYILSYGPQGEGLELINKALGRPPDDENFP